MNEPTYTGKHAEFLADTSSEIDFEGSRFSGKTWVACSKVILSCLENPGTEWLICRYSNEETKNTLRPEFERMMHRHGVAYEWDNNEHAYLFPEVDGKRSRVFAYGLRAQTQSMELSKVRGLNVAGIWNDQSEEMPQKVLEELKFGTRLPGYPHQVIFTPNPPQEDHFLADRFPEDNRLDHRKYYCVSLYENPHVPPEKLKDLEKDYPPTHARYKSLVLGQRGVNVVGTPVYDRVFDRERHFVPVSYNDERVIYEAIQHGEHHPSWVVAQRNYWGGFDVIAALLGKWMFLDEFLERVMNYRKEWFKDGRFETCCDPPPDVGSARFTNIQTMREYGLDPIHHPNANAIDVREAVIQGIYAMMRKQGRAGFRLNSEPSRFLMASREIVKPHKFVVDGFESAYVWDPHRRSVGNKEYRQPHADEWTGGAQRCIENIWINFFASQPSDAEKDKANRDQLDRETRYHRPGGASFYAT